MTGVDKVKVRALFRRFNWRSPRSTTPQLQCLGASSGSSFDKRRRPGITDAMVDIALPLLATAIAAAAVYTLYANWLEYAERRVRGRDLEKRIREGQRDRLLPLGADILLLVSVVALLVGIVLASLPLEEANRAGRWCMGGGLTGLATAAGVAFVIQFIKEGPGS